MKTGPRRLLMYETAEGRCPWQDWFDGLKDKKARATIDARLLRVRRGNFGDCKSVGGGVMELRIHFGPDYRVYFAEDGDVLVVLLCGGAKGTQRKDIQRATAFWKDYRS